MTRKHFSAIAEVLKDLKPNASTPLQQIAHSAELKQWDATVKAFAKFCKAHNGNFDESRFLEAVNK